MRFVPALSAGLERLGLELPPNLAEAFEQLGAALLADPLYPSVSKIADPVEIAEKHFLDALAPLALPCEPFRGNGTILDLGTGGGFPALPLALRFPGRRILAVDAKGKSVEFVRRIAETLGLTQVQPVLGRAEELGRDPAFRETADLVVCRAVAAVRVLVELALPLVRVGGRLLLYKGPQLDEEFAEAGHALRLLGVEPRDLTRHLLEPPLLPFSRGFVLIDKRRPVGEPYPRRNGLPAAKPL